MRTSFIKYSLSIILLSHAIHNYPTENAWCNTLTSEYPVQCSLIGATAALILGTLSYNYYQNTMLNYEQVIENCRLKYKTIYQNVQKYHNFYYSDVQISDWDLKEIIVDNKEEKYPFMAYYTSLMKTSYHLRKHLNALNRQLTTIDTYQTQLSLKPCSEKSAYLQELFLQLSIKGRQLQEYIMETISLVVILKKRIKLFKEYHDDCHHWSQITKNRKLPTL